MKKVIFLTWKSLSFKKEILFATVLSVTLSFTLFLSVNLIRKGVKESFANALSQTDLIVGARGSQQSLLFYTIFGLGSATNNISWKSYEHFSKHLAVKWSVPFSLGDSHKGFRIFATQPEFFSRYKFNQEQSLRFKEGQAPRSLEVVLGADVSEKLRYQIGDKIVVAHGIAEITFDQHDKFPFTIVGVLEKTGTAMDRTLFIDLKSMSEIHHDEEKNHEANHHDEDDSADVTGFLTGLKNRADVLSIQREIAEYKEEPLTATMPGVALADFWKNMSYFENGFSILTIAVLVSGLLGLSLVLYTSLGLRRREMTILRAIGAHPTFIFSLLQTEALLTTGLGLFLGTFIVSSLTYFLKGWIVREFGILIDFNIWQSDNLLYVLAVLAAGFVAGSWPAWKAYRNTIQDGLVQK